MIQYRVPLDGIKFSTNQIYAGVHWAKRKQAKDSIARYAAIFCRPVKKIDAYPVEISYRFVFGTRALDTLNTAAMAKMLEDAFRAIGILKDDSPAYVARTVLESVAVPSEKRPKKGDAGYRATYQKKEDYVEITIKSL